MEIKKVGIVGCGLMGREFGSTIARWCHLTEMDVQPRLTAVCTRNPKRFDWFKENFPSIEQYTADYRELLANPDVDAVYIAVPHNLHESFYCDAIRAGKHLMGEKPFGIDLAANRTILQCIREHPGVFVRCVSHYHYQPPVQRICEMIESDAFGRIIEVNIVFRHSSDLNPDKPINWKRQIEFNGEYGAMGDLGMHLCQVPIRAGWIPLNVRAVLSNIMPERPDGKGGVAACETWDNASLLCEAKDAGGGDRFPMSFKIQRIAPGNTNTWFLEILGTQASARFSMQNPRRLELLHYNPGDEQTWRAIDMGYETPHPTISGSIFEFGFGDGLLQMWAAYLYEMIHGQPIRKFAGCVTPEESAMGHRLFTAALESQRTAATVAV